MCHNRYDCSEEILTITAMLSVNNAVFYRPKVSSPCVVLCIDKTCMLVGTSLFCLYTCVRILVISVFTVVHRLFY